MTPKQLAILQLGDTRRYTQMVLDHTPEGLWFQLPAGVTTHVAWQVGHLTWSMTHHVHGTLPGNAEIGADIIAPRWRKLFGKGSVASPDPAAYPTAAELRAVMDDQFQGCLEALTALPDATLDEPVQHGSGLLRTKLDLLLYLARHEMLHVGQIGLIRRVLGMQPYR